METSVYCRGMVFERSHQQERGFLVKSPPSLFWCSMLKLWKLRIENVRYHSAYGLQAFDAALVYSVAVSVPIAV